MKFAIFKTTKIKSIKIPGPLDTIMGMVFFLKCIAFSSLGITFTLNLMKRLENGFIPRSEYTPEKALLVIFDRYMAFESKPLLQLRGKPRIKVTLDIF